MLQHIPNALTVSRLLLALPLGLLILREQYAWALAVGAFAGLTDALDGFAARRLQAFSRMGSILDPVADKTLILVAFLCFAANDLIPAYLAAIVIGRDIVIAAGAAAYHTFIGAFEFAARGLSKCNMVVQIAFCILVLVNQLAVLPDGLFGASSVLVIGIAIASGIDYVVAWTLRAVQNNMQSGRRD